MISDRPTSHEWSPYPRLSTLEIYKYFYSGLLKDLETGIPTTESSKVLFKKSPDKREKIKQALIRQLTSVTSDIANHRWTRG